MAGKLEKIRETSFFTVLLQEERIMKMRTMTVREAEYLSAKEAIADYPFDFGKQIERFQRYIETSDWDERFIRYVARSERVFISVVILLALAIFLSYSLSL